MLNDPHKAARVIQEAVAHLADGTLISLEAPLAGYTTFQIGGPADVLVEPGSEEAVIAVMRACRDAGLPLSVMGLGSDLLVSDEGVRGVVMRLADRFAHIRVDGETIHAQAGASNAAIAEAACAAGLSGYEFASGIPGTIGGAAIMNAGAYDGELRDAAVSVRCVTPALEVVEIPAREARWAYRKSLMSDEGYVVLEVTLALHPESPAQIQKTMDDLARRRAEKQPLELPSAGSTFKRPEGYFAGKLIQDAGLRGMREGGAQVSEKHTGFVVNAGGATAQDVRRLIARVQERVRETSGVQLEPEVRFWGFEEE